MRGARIRGAWLLLALATAAPGQRYSTDFDGVGDGSYIEVDKGNFNPGRRPSPPPFGVRQGPADTQPGVNTIRDVKSITRPTSSYSSSSYSEPSYTPSYTPSYSTGSWQGDLLVTAGTSFLQGFFSGLFSGPSQAEIRARQARIEAERRRREEEERRRREELERRKRAYADEKRNVQAELDATLSWIDPTDDGLHVKPRAGFFGSTELVPDFFSDSGTVDLSDMDLGEADDALMRNQVRMFNERLATERRVHGVYDLGGGAAVAVKGPPTHEVVPEPGAPPVVQSGNATEVALQATAAALEGMSRAKKYAGAAGPVAVVAKVGQFGIDLVDEGGKRMDERNDALGRALADRDAVAGRLDALRTELRDPSTPPGRRSVIEKEQRALTHRAVEIERRLAEAHHTPAEAAALAAMLDGESLTNATLNALPIPDTFASGGKYAKAILRRTRAGKRFLVETAQAGRRWANATRAVRGAADGVLGEGGGHALVDGAGKLVSEGGKRLYGSEAVKGAVGDSMLYRAGEAAQKGGEVSKHLLKEAGIRGLDAGTRARGWAGGR